MKFPISILLTGALAGQLWALESSALSAVAQKYSGASPDAQYAATVELNALIDRSVMPGEGDPQRATRAVLELLAADATPAEAKKYLLRALARVATVDAVDPMVAIYLGGDEVLADEARQVLTCIADPQAVESLEKLLVRATDKRAKLSLINSLGMQGAASSAPLLAGHVVDADPEIARAALTAMVGIGAPSEAPLMGVGESGQVADAVKADLEKAQVAVATSGDLLATLQTSGADAAVRTAALVARLERADADGKEALIKGVLKGSDAGLRKLALGEGIKLKLDNLLEGLAKSMDRLSLDERVVVLSNLAESGADGTALAIALERLKNGETPERVAALHALAALGSQPAFEAVLAATVEKDPVINRTAANVLSMVEYPEAEALLLAGVKAGEVTAIRALNYRKVEGASAELIKLIKANKQPAAKEAIRTVMISATLDDLKALAAAHAEISDGGVKKRIASTCERIAKSLDSDEARTIANGLK